MLHPLPTVSEPCASGDSPRNPSQVFLVSHWLCTGTLGSPGGWGGSVGHRCCWSCSPGPWGSVRAVPEQGWSSAGCCKELSPCSVPVRLTGSSSPVPELLWFLLGCVSLWEKQHSSRTCCLFGKSFPTAQPLSCAFGSAAVNLRPSQHKLNCRGGWDTSPGWAGHFGVSPCTLRGPRGERSEDRAGQIAWGSHSTFIPHS